MRAAVLVDAKNIELREMPSPDLPKGHLRVRPRYVGLCGTDVHVYRGEFAGRVTYPRVLGHEFSGVVEACGEDTGTWIQGQHVVVDPICWCERCPACLSGQVNACSGLKLYGIDMDGGLAESVVVPESKVFPVPDGLSLKDASIIELMAVACHATRRASIEPGDVVAVLGAGRLGLCLIGVLSTTSAAAIIAVDPSPERLEMAACLGATHTVDPTQTSPLDRVLEWTDGYGADRAIEAVGHFQPIEGVEPPCTLAMSMVRNGGRVVVMGQGDQAQSVIWKPFVFKEAQVVASRVTQGEFPRALRLARSKRISPGRIISKVFPLDRAKEAFHLLDASRPDILKIVVEMPSCSSQ